jgi:hypothetical protein
MAVNRACCSSTKASMNGYIVVTMVEVKPTEAPSPK